MVCGEGGSQDTECRKKISQRAALDHSLQHFCLPVKCGKPRSRWPSAAISALFTQRLHCRYMAIYHQFVVLPWNTALTRLRSFHFPTVFSNADQSGSSKINKLWNTAVPWLSFPPWVWCRRTMAAMWMQSVYEVERGQITSGFALGRWCHPNLNRKVIQKVWSWEVKKKKERERKVSWLDNPQ